MRELEADPPIITADGRASTSKTPVYGVGKKPSGGDPVLVGTFLRDLDRDKDPLETPCEAGARPRALLVTGEA